MNTLPISIDIYVHYPHPAGRGVASASASVWLHDDANNRESGVSQSSTTRPDNIFITYSGGGVTSGSQPDAHFVLPFETLEIPFDTELQEVVCVSNLRLRRIVASVLNERYAKSGYEFAASKTEFYATHHEACS